MKNQMEKKQEKTGLVKIQSMYKAICIQQNSVT